MTGRLGYRGRRTRGGPDFTDTAVMPIVSAEPLFTMHPRPDVEECAPLTVPMPRVGDGTRAAGPPPGSLSGSLSGSLRDAVRPAGRRAASARAEAIGSAARAVEAHLNAVDAQARALATALQTYASYRPTRAAQIEGLPEGVVERLRAYGWLVEEDGPVFSDRDRRAAIGARAGVPRGRRRRPTRPEPAPAEQLAELVDGRVGELVDGPGAEVGTLESRAPVPRRPWRRVLCWAAFGHLWLPGTPDCLECGARRRALVSPPPR